jgi:hypothetical protein
MSVRPRVAVLAVLAAAGAAAGGYFLWPGGRHVAASCPPLHAPVPKEAQNALASYVGRIRHSVERQPNGERQETWADSLAGRTREVLIRPDGHVENAFETIRSGRWMRTVWVLYDGHAWMSHRMRVPAGASLGFTAADEGQANRDRVAHRTATIVGKAVIDGKPTLRLRQLTRPHRSIDMPSFRIDTWVDALTYVTLRTRIAAGGHTSTTSEDWLPRNSANVARTRIAIPAGFTRAQRRASDFTASTQSVTLRSRDCA